MSATTPLTDAINALTTYSNSVTGASDTDLSSAVATLAAGYGGGGSSNIRLLDHSILTYNLSADTTWDSITISTSKQTILNNSITVSLGETIDLSQYAILVYGIGRVTPNYSSAQSASYQISHWYSKVYGITKGSYSSSISNNASRYQLEYVSSGGYQNYWENAFYGIVAYPNMAVQGYSISSVTLKPSITVSAYSNYVTVNALNAVDSANTNVYFDYYTYGMPLEDNWILNASYKVYMQDATSIIST